MMAIRAQRRPEGVHRQAGGGGERDDGNAERPEGDRRGVCNQTNEGGVERREAEAGEHGGGHGDGRAKPGRAFNEGSEGEADQDGLQAAILAEGADGVFDDLELARLERDSVEDERGDDDPADREQTKSGAVNHRGPGLGHGHPENADGQYQSDAEGAEAGYPTGLAFDAQHEEEDEERYGGHHGGVAEVIRDGQIVLFPHRFSYSEACSQECSTLRWLG